MARPRGKEGSCRRLRGDFAAAGQGRVARVRGYFGGGTFITRRSCWDGPSPSRITSGPVRHGDDRHPLLRRVGRFVPYPAGRGPEEALESRDYRIQESVFQLRLGEGELDECVNASTTSSTRATTWSTYTRRARTAWDGPRCTAPPRPSTTAACTAGCGGEAVRASEARSRRRCDNCYAVAASRVTTSLQRAAKGRSRVSTWPW